MTQYGIFGAIEKEPPQLTTARSILGLGRDTGSQEIKGRYHKLVVEWHPDKHHGKPTEEEATQKTALYASAYKLLTDSTRRKEAEERFSQALRHPFFVGNRTFCLGSLYGMRIYIPQGNATITDASRLLTGEHSGSSTPPRQHYIVYGIRESILESQLADLIEVFYSGGSNYSELLEGFSKEKYGGLDDLVWIRDNDLAVDHFLNRRFSRAAWRMQEANKACPGNIILMYRHGVCLEAFAAQNKSQGDKWKELLKIAIGLYENCLERLENRKVWEEGEYMGEKRDLLVPKPESKLTILMQLADAYSELGRFLKSRNIWAEVRKIDPNCYEAKEKGRHPLLTLPVIASRAVGLLPKPK